MDPDSKSLIKWRAQAGLWDERFESVDLGMPAVQNPAMPEPRVIAWWSPNPDEIRIELDLPSRVRLAELSKQMMSPAYTASKQSLYREAYRVEELLYNREREVQLALGRCIPVIFSRQDRFMRSGVGGHRSNVSLQELASEADTRPSGLAVAFEGLACRVPGRIILFDYLIGPRKPVTGEKTGFIRPDKLIPTDALRDQRGLDEYVQVFKKRRQDVLDPVPVLLEPENEETWYVLEPRSAMGSPTGRPCAFESRLHLARREKRDSRKSGRVNLES